ncbi:hypothetical protein EC957_007787 [Mortierella hygrophila]|uniref:F-box domain-containing protein n=1 Tax=Mortierella hygrophila TaxID=979708 RepID=A0A9P6EXM2_9FUNG|nr:hypothetical protein EC957_007787 [Mortierella hygrophila]
MHQEENALNLPEIRSIIGQYLTRQDLIHASKVSHTWRQSFKPLIWRETILRSSQNPNRITYLPPPPLSIFREHGHLIQSLTLEGPVEAEEVQLAAEGCKRVEHLRLSATVPLMPSSSHAPNNNFYNNHNNNGRRNNDENSGPSNPVSTAGRWNLLLLAEGGDDEVIGGDSDSGSDSGSNQDHHEDNEDDDGVRIIGVDGGGGGGESSDDSFWSDWNRNEYDFDYESDDEPINSLGPGRGGGRIDMWKRLAELVLQNRATLRELEIVLLSPPPCGIPHLSFWETVIDCFPPPLSYSSSILTSLSLVGREIRGVDLMLIWRAACPHLTRLELARCSVENEAPLWGESIAEITEAAAMVMETEPRPPSALRHLKLVEVRGMMPRTQFKVFIANSPKLNSLVWQLHRSHAGLVSRELWVTTEDDFWQDYRGQEREEPLQQWMELTSLELTSGKESLAVSDQQLAILLDRASDTMERLALGNVLVGDATFRSIRRFFEGMVDLDLRLCSNVTGDMIQQVLASCPGLKSVAADSIHASDIMDGDPWVCLGLQSWTVFIDLSVALPSSRPSSSSSSSDSRLQGSGRQQQQAHNRRQGQKGKLKAYDRSNRNNDNQQDDELQQLLQQCVFERLSTLTRLEHLDLDRHYPITGRAALKGVEALDWRLRKGLDKLVTLTRLTKVCLSSHQTMNMSKSAAVWMIEHWLQLEVVRGRLGERKGDHKELARLFQRNGIQVD